MPGERTEQATQHRRDKARREGDVLHSRELSAAAATLAGVITLGALGGSMLLAWQTAFAAFLNLGAAIHWEPSQLQPTLIAVRRLSVSVLMPPAIVMAAVALAALGIGILQTGGLNVHVEAVGFNFSRIN